MVQPIDYMLNAPSIGQMFSQGLESGQLMAARSQGMEIASAEEARRAEEFAAQQAEAEAQRQSALAVQQSLMGLAEKMADGSATYADIAAVSLAHPEVADQLKTVWDGQTAERRANDIAGLYKAGAALKAGRPDLAAQMFEDYATAAENSGQKMDADLARAMAAMAKASPESALTNIGLLLGALDEDAAKGLFGEGPSVDERFKVVGDQLVDLSAEGGPKPVDLGEQLDGPDWRVATPQEAGAYGAQFGQINTKTGEFKPISPPQNGITITNPDGTTTQIGGPAGSGKPLTEDQSKNVGFAIRMEGALATLDGTPDKPGVADALTSVAGRAVESDPTGVARGFQSDEFQMASNAGNEFLTALLRKDSGGAITPDEVATYGRTYLPQPGDGEAVLVAKKAARARALEGLKKGLPAEAILKAEEGGSGSQGGSGAKWTVDGYTIEEAP